MTIKKMVTERSSFQERMGISFIPLVVFTGTFTLAETIIQISVFAGKRRMAM